MVAIRTSFAAPATVLTPEEIERVRSQGKDVQLIVPQSREELDHVLPEVNAVFGAVNAEMLAKAKNLRWMQHTEAGMENVLFPELVKSSVVVTNMARMYAPAISETAIAMLLALTGYQAALVVVAACFILFALVAALVAPELGFS